MNVVRSEAKQGAQVPDEWLDLISLISELRIIKSESEIACIRQAVDVAAEAHHTLMKHCQPGQFEYELEGLFLYECVKQGCRQLAYPSIVGGGSNGCVLHYTDNQAVLNAGDLVLVDAGINYEGYASDITRTYPVSGRFSPDQKIIYEWVLRAQQAAIEKIKPGLAWNIIQETIVGILTQGLLELNILKGEWHHLVQSKAYRPYYRHSSGHWLGLEVHDVGNYRTGEAWRLLEPGMVLTVEPGLYFPPDDQQIDKRWRGLAVRIEDDILVTASGCEVLSSRLPKTVDAIEQSMAHDQ